MDVLIKLLGEQWVIGVVQMLLGAVIKPTLKDKLLTAGVRATGVIPLLNVLVAYIGLQVLPVSANAAGFVASLIPIREGVSVLGMALLQTIMITGTHSTLKNTVIPVGKVGLSWLLNKLQALVVK